jgi:hypothetical protein
MIASEFWMGLARQVLLAVETVLLEPPGSAKVPLPYPFLNELSRTLSSEGVRHRLASTSSMRIIRPTRRPGSVV